MKDPKSGWLSEEWGWVKTLYQKNWAEWTLSEELGWRIRLSENTLSEELGQSKIQKNWSEWKYFIRRIGPSENTLSEELGRVKTKGALLQSATQ